MNGRTWVRLPYVLALVLTLALSAVAKANAQSGSLTSDAVACVDKAADALKSCVDDLPWYAEALCYARYASDGILCGPTILLKAL